ncbi:hypothetical protein ACHAXM_010279 [Skeletonema potamos]
MNTSPFRSHLMQQFYSAAKNQSRPPLVLATTFGNNYEGSSHRRGRHHRASTTSPSPMLSSLNTHHLPHPLSSSSRTFREASNETKPASNDDATHHDLHEPSIAAQSLQQMISSRRTVSNFLNHPPSLSVERDMQCQQILSNAIKRGVECAFTAPNHKITEPTTFHRILTPSAASERLLDISYQVTYQRLLCNKLSGVEACRNEAMRKREKWSTIPAFLVATVGGMEDQYQQDQEEEQEEEQTLYQEIPFIAPRTIQQLEDYASSCASIQNFLLSLHSEGLASKWATGPIIRTHALRNLIGCRKDDMIVGLIMIGWPKRVPRMPVRRREVEGDMLKDVTI